MSDNYDEIGKTYAKHSISGTSYLSFKNIPELIQTYVQGKKALDFGCGSGRSTRFLAALGLDVCGVDINASIIQEAKNHADSAHISYQQIDHNICYSDNTFDLVFSAMVLVTIPSVEQQIEIFKEIKRILKPNGIFIVVTASPEQYTHKWYSIETDFPENQALKSGDLAKICLKHIQLELQDYYWTEQDYQYVIEKAGFSIVKTDHPLGDDSDNYPWVSETKISPYLCYVLSHAP